MGLRSGFVRSDDEDEEENARDKGESSSRQNKRRSAEYSNFKKSSSINQGSGPECSTLEKCKVMKRLRRSVDHATEDFCNDSSDEEYCTEVSFEPVIESQQTNRKTEKRRLYKKCPRSRTEPLKSVKKRSLCPNEGVEEPHGDMGFEREGFMDIQATNIPERLNIEEEIGAQMSLNGDWIVEANWIYDRLVGSRAANSLEKEFNSVVVVDRDEIVQEIIFVLEEIHNKKYEIPFIGTYRYYGCSHLACKDKKSHTTHHGEESGTQLNPYKILWHVFDLHMKWLFLCRRKHLLEETYKKRVAHNDVTDAAKGAIVDEILKDLRDAESEQSISDLDAKFRLYFPPEAVTPIGQYKRPKQHSYYTICCRSGFGNLTKQFVLTTKQMWENVEAEQKIHKPPCLSVCPEEVDLGSFSGSVRDVAQVLRGARHVAAYELSCEPRIRGYVRSTCSQQIVISARLTEEGKTRIDSFSDWSLVKHVQEKPIVSLLDGEWLILQKAEKDNLLEVAIDVPQDVLNDVIMSRLEESYLSNGSTSEEKLWDEQRKGILKEVILDMLMPMMVNEIRVLLTTKAKSWIQSKCSDSLWKIISIAPYHPPNCNPTSGHETENSSEVARVLACCWGSRNPPTTFVMVDCFGKKVDILQTGYLNLPSNCSQQQLERKMDDRHRLQKFIVKYKPQVIIVGASTNMGCRFLKDTIKETLSMAADEDSQLSSVPVIYGDESIPSIYENSQASMTEMPDESGVVRRAIALGRSFQNPLAIVASLCCSSRDIVALNLDSMQQFLTEDERYSAIEQVMVTVTNQVGVDVNLAVEHEWLFAPLQFVSGLGPQRASLLKQLIQKLRRLPSRKKLLKHPYTFGKTIFTNCAGFLRICAAPNMESIDDVNPLDGTRVHPDLYDLAKDLAVHAVSKNQPSMLSEMEVDLSRMAIKCIRNNPGILSEDVLLDFFELQKGVRDVKMEILKDIQAELIYGFRDYRASYTWPSEDDEFRWLTGENEVGTTVNVTVCRVFQHRMVCVLGSGVRGFIEKEDFMTEGVDDLRDLISEGSSLTCRISGFLKDKFALQLTCIENNLELQDVQTTGSTFEHVQICAMGGQKRQNDGLLNHRKIFHKLFQNISRQDALKVLRESEDREVIFHPSSRGPSCLSMIFKLHGDIFVHKDIVELEKDTADLTSFSKLGKLLKIDSSIYSDLDEVVSSYIHPLLTRLKEVQASRNYLTNENEVTHFLCQPNEAYTENPSYCLSLCQRSPGAITISYTTSGNIKQDRIDLYPEGYGFQGKMFRKIETLINYLSNMLTTSERFIGCRGGRGGRYGSGSGRRGRGREGGGTKNSYFSDSNQCETDGTCNYDTFSGDWGIDADGTENQGRGTSGQRGNYRGGRGRNNGGRGRRQFKEGNDSHEYNSFWNEKNSIQGKSISENRSGDDGWGLTTKVHGKGGDDDGWGCENPSNAMENSNFDGWGSPMVCQDPSDERRSESGWGGEGVWGIAKKEQQSKSGWEDGVAATQKKETISEKQTVSGWGSEGGWGAAEKVEQSESGWGGGQDASEQKEFLEEKLTDSGWGGDDAWATSGENEKETGSARGATGKKEKETDSEWGSASEQNKILKEKLTDSGWGAVGKEKGPDSGWGCVEHASEQNETINKKLIDSGWGSPGKKENGANNEWGNREYASRQKEIIKEKPTDSEWGAVCGSGPAGKKEKETDRGWGIAELASADSGWGGDGDWGTSGKKENETDSGWGGGQYESEPKEIIKEKLADSGWGDDGGWGPAGNKKETDSGWGLGGHASKQKETINEKSTDSGWEAPGKEEGTNSGWGGGDDGWGAGGRKKKETEDGWGGDGGWGADKETKSESGWGDSGNASGKEVTIRKTPNGGGWGGGDDGWGAGGRKKKETEDGWGGDGGWGADKETKSESGWGDSGNASGKEVTIRKTPNGGGCGNERASCQSSDWGTQGDGLLGKYSGNSSDQFRRGGFGGGRGRGGGFRNNGGEDTGNGHRGNWSENDFGRGRGGRGNWAQNESGRGRSGRGNWAQNESGRGRSGRANWDQNGSGRGRGGRAGRFQSGFDRGRGRGRGNGDNWSRNANDSDWGGRNDARQQPQSDGSTAFGKDNAERYCREDDGWSVDHNQKSSWEGWSEKQDDGANNKGSSVWGNQSKEMNHITESHTKENDGWLVGEQKKATCESMPENSNDAADMKENNQGRTVMGSDGWAQEDPGDYVNKKQKSIWDDWSQSQDRGNKDNANDGWGQ